MACDRHVACMAQIKNAHIFLRKTWMEEFLEDLSVCMRGCMKKDKKNLVSRWELNLTCPHSFEHSNKCDI